MSEKKKCGGKKISVDGGKTFMDAKEFCAFAKEHNYEDEWETIGNTVDSIMTNGWMGPCFVPPPNPRKGFDKLLECEDGESYITLYLEKYADEDLVLDFSKKEEEE